MDTQGFRYAHCVAQIRCARRRGASGRLNWSLFLRDNVSGPQGRATRPTAVAQNVTMKHTVKSKEQLLCKWAAWRGAPYSVHSH